MVGTVIGDLDNLVDSFSTLQTAIDNMNKTMASVQDGIGSLNAKTNPQVLTPTVLSKLITKTFTIAQMDIVYDLSEYPMSSFSLQVKATGNVTSWNVILEGGLDGQNMTTILQHQQTNLTGTTLFTGSLKYPCNYIRMKCVSITLGTGTNVIATALAIR